MSRSFQGKLELLFTGLSLNGVQNSRPVVQDVLREYECMTSNLTCDQKKSVDLIKRFLLHVEREEWQEARENLHGAESAYHEYIKTRNNGSQQSKVIIFCVKNIHTYLYVIK